MQPFSVIETPCDANVITLNACVKKTQDREIDGFCEFKVQVQLVFGNHEKGL
jgi:hypothetical protein